MPRFDALKICREDKKLYSQQRRWFVVRPPCGAPLQLHNFNFTVSVSADCSYSVDRDTMATFPRRGPFRSFARALQSPHRMRLLQDAGVCMSTACTLCHLRLL